MLAFEKGRILMRVHLEVDRWIDACINIQMHRYIDI